MSVYTESDVDWTPLYDRLGTLLRDELVLDYIPEVYGADLSERSRDHGDRAETVLDLHWRGPDCDYSRGGLHAIWLGDRLGVAALVLQLIARGE